MSTTRTPLTQADLLAGYANEDWLGYGYLGERRHFESEPELVAAADARILAEANARRWSRQQLFDWSNSKLGRWAGEALLGGASPESVERQLPSLMQAPR